ncbi:hypothetical protein OH809_44500 (plasmid) [Streptomyces sp. NBC_00873]|uniref:hypothetical protein n=1 Tax=unclassified Streptomyces TaxID=2593676 RepID=UPI002F90BB70|nr:hypothetical protein OH809_44500 [Streptomyces sp. NBC_00873]WTA49277.1 hypothetical protein OH821_44140 [Streptomyces sp. NBC_00842]
MPSSFPSRADPVARMRLISPAARDQSARTRAAEREQTKRQRADRMLSRLT